MWRPYWRLHLEFSVQYIMLLFFSSSLDILFHIFLFLLLLFLLDGFGTESLRRQFTLFLTLPLIICKIHVELAPNNLAARCLNERGLVTFKVSWQVGGRVGMVNPPEKKDTGGWGGDRKCFTKDGYSTSLVRLVEEDLLHGLDSRSGGTRDQMEVCLDNNGLPRRGQIIWRKLYQKSNYLVISGRMTDKQTRNNYYSSIAY